MLKSKVVWVLECKVSVSICQLDLLEGFWGFLPRGECLLSAVLSCQSALSSLELWA